MSHFCRTPQVVSLGLVLGSDSYLRCRWNVLDGILVSMSMIDMIVTLADPSHNNAEKSMLGIFKVLRLLRTMRPLR
uniref:Ion transport domain-containing protein n=1 Tax=Knipowitschia caucasica TaxID=637954 RepID=A0AAV2JQB6_KNICA